MNISIRNTDSPIKRGVFPKVKIVEFHGKDSIYPANSITLPFPGEIIIPQFGCIPLSPGQELVFEGDDAEDLLLSSELKMYPKNEDIFCNRIGLSLWEHHDTWEVERISLLHEYWILSEGAKMTKKFLNMTEAIQSFSRKRMSGYKSLLRQQGTHSQTICGFDSCSGHTELSINPALSKAEWKILKNHEQYADFSVPDYHPRVKKSSLREIQSVIEDFEHQFNHWFYASSDDQGQYEVLCMLGNLPKDWFMTGCMKNIPDFYDSRVMADGKIRMKLPKKYDTWSDQEIRAELQKFFSSVSIKVFYWELDLPFSS